MTNNKQLIINLKRKILPILKKHHIKKAGIFGSYARGEQTKKSDIDILVELPSGIGFGFAGIELELEKKLRKKVDLLTYNGINKRLKTSILDDEIRIL
ncbi:nucleotidyltransferase family protein [Candidatus Woesearchaeota archaeon]|nr:nucleotidyltransferase family protein [Candidatus Woesearchaeota archaeon]